MDKNILLKENKTDIEINTYKYVRPKILFYKNSKIEKTETHILDSFEKLTLEKNLFEDLGIDNLFFRNLYDFINRLTRRPPFRLLSKLIRNIIIKFLLYLQLFRYKPDIVLAQFGPSGVKIRWSAQKYGCHLITYFRGYDASRNCESLKNNSIYNNLFKYCSATICTSPYLRDNIIELGANPHTSFVLPSGVNTDLLKSINNEKKKHGKRFISVGRFVDKKAHHITILAFKRVLEKYPDSELVIIGSFNVNNEDRKYYWEYCNKLTKELGIDHAVRFLGYLPHIYIFENLLEADIYVQHSIIADNGNSEGTPVAIMEASAAGLPVIATNHSGIPDVIIHGVTGYLVEENDLETMADHMLELLKKPLLRNQMGIKGKIRAEKYFSHKVIIPRLEHILKWVHSPQYVDKPELIPNIPK